MFGFIRSRWAVVRFALVPETSPGPFAAALPAFSIALLE